MLIMGSVKCVLRVVRCAYRVLTAFSVIVGISQPQQLSEIYLETVGHVLPSISAWSAKMSLICVQSV